MGTSLKAKEEGPGGDHSVFAALGYAVPEPRAGEASAASGRHGQISGATVCTWGGKHGI